MHERHSLEWEKKKGRTASEALVFHIFFFFEMNVHAGRKDQSIGNIFFVAGTLEVFFLVINEMR